jgi:hypothetical protein
LLAMAKKWKKQQEEEEVTETVEETAESWPGKAGTFWKDQYKYTPIIIILKKC